jgi:hypothetical protein
MLHEADLKLVVELSEGFLLEEPQNELDCFVAHLPEEELASHVQEVVGLDDSVVLLLEEDLPDLWS